MSAPLISITTKKQSAALAVFVKTPGLSPLKTRLAKAIGTSGAQDFYRQSLNCLRSTFKEIEKRHQNLKIYWAVAESDPSVLEFWPDYEVLFQGDGELGQRLLNIHKQLSSGHQKIIFIGADSPNLQAQEISNTLTKLEKIDYVLGPTFDGGYYLFASSKPVEESIWLKVPYSAPNTCDVFASFLEQKGSLDFLPKITDVDVFEDFFSLRKELKGLAIEKKAHAEHLKLLDMLEAYP